ncbi:MAG: DEAD/DEAH box helicase, partial [Actinomycetota bacterium]
FELHEELRSLEKNERSPRRGARHEEVLEAISALRPGDVFHVSGGKRKGRYAVLEVTQKKSERRPRVLALSEERSMVRFAPAEFRDPPRPVGSIRMPGDFDVRDPKARRHVARRLSQIELEPPRGDGPPRRTSSQRVDRLRGELERHPCHACPDLGRHVHFAERATRLSKQITGIDKRVRRRTGTLARRFERTLEVLARLGHVEGWALTAKGATLTRVYNESDLLVVEALERGLLDELSPAELAAVVSALVYEARGPETEYVGQMPTRSTASVWSRLMRLWREIRDEEDLRGLELTREPDPGFAERAYLWASGATLDEVLGYDDAPGDFVRSMKQLVDLLRQLEEVAHTDDFAANTRTALGAVNRGVVAYSSV